jgi:hypothetical protein
MTIYKRSQTKFVEKSAEHDRWFRAQVEQSLQEADDPSTVWLSNEEVKARSAARRAKWAQCVKKSC